MLLIESNIMLKRSVFTVHKFPGNRYADLATAQAKALHPLACNLTTIIHSLVALGTLVNSNGRIIQNPEKIEQ